MPFDGRAEAFDSPRYPGSFGPLIASIPQLCVEIRRAVEQRNSKCFRYDFMLDASQIML